VEISQIWDHPKQQKSYPSTTWGQTNLQMIHPKVVDFLVFSKVMLGPWFQDGTILHLDTSGMEVWDFGFLGGLVDGMSCCYEG